VTAYDDALGVVAWLLRNGPLAQRGRRECGGEAVLVGSVGCASRMREGAARDGKGVISIPAPGATSLSSTLSMKISNASTVRGKGSWEQSALSVLSGTRPMVVFAKWPRAFGAIVPLSNVHP
jgi:hypothetical protein